MTRTRTRTHRRRRTPEPSPLATIAPYGPDNRLATKLVVSIVPDADLEPSETRTWTTVAVDVRNDPTIAAEVARFLNEQAVGESVTADRILGCPHEEGIDYPMGRTCPQCPFWADLDRFTHEPVTLPVPMMSAAEVLDVLTDDDPDRLEAALASADGLRDALVDPLLAAIDRALDSPEDRGTTLDGYALYLLAHWREPRAYPSVVRWLSLPEEDPFEVAGDIVTEAGSRILASVCDGGLEPIRRLVIDDRASEFGRSAGIGALALLAAWKEVPREPVIEAFLGFARGDIERDASFLWESLVLACLDMEAIEVFPELRRAFRDGLIDEVFINQTELDEVEADAGARLRAVREGQPPIGDVLEETSWWDRSGVDEEFIDVSDPVWDRRDPVVIQEPYRAEARVGRNDPCPCGSGKKYKKCCGGVA